MYRSLTRWGHALETQGNSEEQAQDNAAELSWIKRFASVRKGGNGAHHFAFLQNARR